MVNEKLRRWSWWIVVFAAVVGGVAAARSYSRSVPRPVEKAEGMIEAVTVTVEPVTVRPVRRTVNGVGSLWGWEEVPITPKVEGRTIRVHKDVGDIVRPGDVLLEIDPTDFQLAVSEAERAVELELAKIGLKEIAISDPDLTRVPSVQRAEALIRQAEARYTRMRAGGRAVTEEEMNQTETDLLVAKANHSLAIMEAKSILAGVRQRQAMLATARQRLADTKILVPPPTGLPSGAIAEYVVGYRKVSVGEIVRIIPFADVPPLFRLILDRPLRLQVSIPERHKAEIAVGQPVELEVESQPGRKFSAQVSRIGPTVDRSSRTFMVEVLVPNTNRELSAGSFAGASIVTKQSADTLTVPEEAVVNFAGVSKVFVMVDGKAKSVDVRVGGTQVLAGAKPRTWVEITGGIKQGDQVITSGHSRIADGVAVRLR